MNTLKSLSLAAAAVAACLAVSAPEARAQVGVDLELDPAQECPYGYYDYAPYDCAPSGYYSPEWFVQGIFIGVGPWFHGPYGFRGHVDNRYDPRYGYHGDRPHRGDRPDWSHHSSQMEHFNGNEMHDGRGGFEGPGGGHEGGGHEGGGRR